MCSPSLSLSPSPFLYFSQHECECLFKCKKAYMYVCCVVLFLLSAYSHLTLTHHKLGLYCVHIKILLIYMWYECTQKCVCEMQDINWGAWYKIFVARQQQTCAMLSFSPPPYTSLISLHKILPMCICVCTLC